MKILFLLFIHLIVTMVKLLGPGGVRGVIAETMAVKHQLLIANRSRKRAPNLTPTDRALLGIWALLIRPHRLGQLAVVVSIATLFKFPDVLKKRKYRRLFSTHGKRKPGPKGPSEALIKAIVEMKKRNQLANAFGIEVDKDVVRRVLAKYDRPLSGILISKRHPNRQEQPSNP